MAGEAMDLWSLVRASDTFTWLTGDGAEHLRTRATKRRASIHGLRTAAGQISDGPVQADAARELDRAEADALAQENLANFLLSLAAKEVNK